jgi:RNA polymerase sigma factor (sigma-70 family)
MSTDDPALISRAQRGDVSAFEALVQPHQQSLLRLILATNPNPDDAQDCLQEALISAYRAIPRFRCESGFRTWLCRIALNVTRNWIRAEARASAQRFRQDPLRILSPASTNIDENLLREDDANTIRRALAALPAHGTTATFPTTRSPAHWSFQLEPSGQDSPRADAFYYNALLPLDTYQQQRRHSRDELPARHLPCSPRMRWRAHLPPATIPSPPSRPLSCVQ